MVLSDIKIAPELLQAERLKSARLSVTFRWILFLLVLTLTLIQYYLGYIGISRYGMTLIAVYFISNLVLWIAVRKKRSTVYLSYLSATLDILIVCYYIFGMTSHYDPTAATAASAIILIPIIYLIYTFQLERGLLIYLMVISIISFNLIYFVHYFQNPDLLLANLSLSPISHVFKSFYIVFIGLICIYMQHSMSIFIEKQLSETEKKAQLDAEVRIEQQKNRFAQQLIDKERALNEKLGEEIRKKDALAGKLKESKEQLDGIISNLIGFTYRCIPNNEWTMMFISDQIESVSGYTTSWLLGNSVSTYNSIIHPDDQEFVKKHILEAISKKDKFGLEYRIVHKDGHHVWVYEAGRGVYDSRGNVQYVDGIITDISERKKVEIELNETRDLMKTLISNLVGAVSRSLYDEYFTTKFGSEKIYDITGYPIDDFIDNKNIRFSDIIFHEDAGKVKEVMDYSVKNKKPYSAEFRIVHKDGHLVWVNDNGQPIFDKYGNLLYLDGITTDITEKKAAEQALIDAKLELEQLNEKLEKTIEERTEKLTEANTQLLKLQKENIQSQFEVLKQQVNPHFLFNSLNVLTSLIKVDPDLAEVFTERLSKVYRYVLENKDKDLVSLETEMDFIRAYIFLLDIRFANKVFVNIHFDEKDVDAYVAPLALQLIIENAIKHNTFSRTSPLCIDLFIDENRFLHVVNNLQSRKTQMSSTGVGLVNIVKRYSLLTDVQPVFEMTDTQFFAKIPLLDKDSRNEY
jgi:PAS domain S-box-containing protein